MPADSPSSPSRRRFIGSSLVGLLGTGVAGAATGQGAPNGAGPDKGEARPPRQWVAYCGLYCGLCSEHGKLKALAADLARTLEADENPRPPEFWTRLEELRDTPPEHCCRTGRCGHPRCAIRGCAKRKGVFVCAECDQYPCDKVKTLAASEPTLLYDGGRLQKIGLDAWIEEQERRREAGFCYSDIRCGHCVVPTE